MKSKSIKGTVLMLFIAFSVVLTAVCIIVSGIDVNESLEGVMECYMEDMATSGGEVSQTLFKEFEGNIPAEKLTEYFGEMVIEELPSSYAMVVDANTNTFLFHHSPDKIGTEVTNTVISGLVADIQAGKSFEQEAYCEYEYNGATKMAAYSVVADNNLVFVMAADKTDITSMITAVIVKVIVASVIFLVVMVVIVFIVMTKIFNPLGQVTDIVRQIGQFDLTENVAQTAWLCSRRDEVGQIANAVKELRNGLRDTVENLVASAGVLSSAATELADNSEQVKTSMNDIDAACTDIADGATSQAHETESATTAAIEMGNEIEASTNAVEELKVVSDQVKVATYSAGDKLAEVRETNQKVTEATEEIRISIMGTSESAEKIQAAADAITNIASQTNLLSLNASIEAARAGEAGRGFAVVASEIQKLSDESNQSAVEIQNIIRELIENSNRSVEDIKEAKAITEEQTQKLEAAIDEFVKAKNGLDKSLSEINKVEKSTEELNVSKETVLDMIQSLSAISEENAASTEETAASITQAKEVVDAVNDKAANVNDIAAALANDANKWTL